ncbi:MAG: recombinase RmuC [candidate division Zixibacteria bacterium 4484_95]|nr:MAG: recombinase RmuC [candidate division Zixibacteria bacterium 4484_95]
MSELLYLIIGIVVGVIVVLLISYLRRKDTKALAQQLVLDAQAEKLKDLESFLGRIKESFDSVSMEALNKSLKQHLEIAKSALSEQSALGAKELESKKDLISQTYKSMKDELEKVSSLITEFEKDRQKKYGELTNLLSNTSNELNRLQETTGKLTTALSSASMRGQWGERMAEDVLKLAGFIEGINYYKQKTLESSRYRPDFTFTLPNNQKINMDVKFPFDNYWHYLEADNSDDKNRFKNMFLRDVRNHIRDVTSRDYINPDDNTLPYVIMFIPNEQVYSFINESDRSILDEAIENKVALCSPLTLFAILAIIRQAVENFKLESTAGQMSSLMGNFKKQWELFIAGMNKMGKRIDDAQREYNRLVTTRKNQLQKPLDKIEELRIQKGLPISEIEEVGFDEENFLDVKNDD